MCVCRASLKSGLVFNAARPSDPALWDMVVEPGQGDAPNVVSVVCQRKVAVTTKRSVQVLLIFQSSIIIRGLSHVIGGEEKEEKDNLCRLCQYERKILTSFFSAIT